MKETPLISQFNYNSVYVGFIWLVIQSSLIKVHRSQKLNPENIDPLTISLQLGHCHNVNSSAFSRVINKGPRAIIHFNFWFNLIRHLFTFYFLPQTGLA